MLINSYLCFLYLVVSFAAYPDSHFFSLSALEFPGGSDSKASAYNAGDLGSIPGLKRSPGEGNGNSSILTWRISWTEEPGGLQSTGSQESNTT